jgi:hypothetical protein
MRLKLIQLRRRPAMRWPSDASLDPATRGTAKAGKPHRDLAEKRGYRVAPVVLHVADAAAVWANWASKGVVPGLRSDNLLLEACQQPLRFGQGQTQIGDVAEVIGAVDLHDVCARSLALSANLYQSYNPGHAPPHPEQARKMPRGAYIPNLATVPFMHQRRATEVAIAVCVLDRMLALGRPNYVRIA